MNSRLLPSQYGGFAARGQPEACALSNPNFRVDQFSASEPQRASVG